MGVAYCTVAVIAVRPNRVSQLHFFRTWGAGKIPFSGLALRAGAISHAIAWSACHSLFPFLTDTQGATGSFRDWNPIYGSRLGSLFRRRSAAPTLAKPRCSAASATFCFHFTRNQLLSGASRVAAHRRHPFGGEGDERSGTERSVPERRPGLELGTLVLAALTSLR